jgi:putative intracellular protease/amidase
VRYSPIHEQLLAAFKKTGWSIPELLKKSGLDLDRTGLWRKLHGKTGFSFEEVGALVDAFRKAGHTVELVWPKKKRAA